METTPDMNKIVIIIICALLVLGGVWFIFSYQSEKFEGGSPVNTTTTGISDNNIYTNQAFGFEVAVPRGFTVDESYINQALGPGREIPGVAFRIPSSWTTGTNLSQDSHIAVEELSDVDCVPSTFLDSPTIESRVVPGTNTFTVATENGAGAGNRYDETVYLTFKGNRCYAVRSFIHYGVLENYPTGTVKAFDARAFRTAFDAIASSLVIY
jgi:hypothetical protein